MKVFGLEKFLPQSQVPAMGKERQQAPHHTARVEMEQAKSGPMPSSRSLSCPSLVTSLEPMVIPCFQMPEECSAWPCMELILDSTPLNLRTRSQTLARASARGSAALLRAIHKDASGKGSELQRACTAQGMLA